MGGTRDTAHPGIAAEPYHLRKEVRLSSAAGGSQGASVFAVWGCIA